MYKAADIAKFVDHWLKPHVPAAYQLYGIRDLVRMRGNFAHLLLIASGRGHYLKILPTLYVVGANIADETIHQTVSLYVESESNSWNFSPAILDGAFASQVIRQLGQASETKFVDEINDVEIDLGLRWFGKDRRHWAADLFLAFFNMTRGAPTARKDLGRAFQIFLERSRYATDKPPFDWEKALHARFKELEARLDRSDCIALCRADAQAHAQILKLPLIEWPPEWPESLPPWPKETATGIKTKLSRLFGG